MSFLHAKEALFAVGLCLAAILILWRGRLTTDGLRAFLPLWVLTITGVVIHLLVRPCRVPEDAIIALARQALVLTGVALAFDLLAGTQWRKRMMLAIGIGTALTALFGLLQYAGLVSFMFPRFPGYHQPIYSVFGNQDLYGGFLVLGLPVWFDRFLRKKKTDGLTLLALALIVPGLLLSGCRSAWLATIPAVMLAVPVQGHFPKTARLGTLVLALAIGTLVIAPAATIGRITHTFASDDEGTRARLWFWDGTVRMVRDQPFVGVGPGNYAYWSPSYLGEALHAPDGDDHYHNERMTDHPHSEPLRLFAETGFLGFTLALWMLWRIPRRRGPEWGGLVALFVFSLFNGALESLPHAFIGVLYIGMLLATPNSPKNLPEYPATAVESRLLPFGLTGLSFALYAFHAWAVLLPSHWLRAAEDLNLAGKPALSAYERVLAHGWVSAAAHEKYAIALAEAGRNPEAKQQFEAALDGADWGQLYLGLGSLAVESGDLEAARDWLHECLWRWPSSPHAWQLLLQATPPKEQGKLMPEARRWLKPNEYDELVRKVGGLIPEGGP
ncbi:MAG: O-antigen ligase family protein [Candidatus Hydrogenedentes bacterium]|nr:O-antigen ligase family protein [Candidatus Hydrogenedentota bacterium]